MSIGTGIKDLDVSYEVKGWGVFLVSAQKSKIEPSSLGNYIVGGKDYRKNNKIDTKENYQRIYFPLRAARSVFSISKQEI